MSQITKNRQTYRLVTTLIGGLLALSSINIASASETVTSSRSISYSLADASSTQEKHSNWEKPNRKPCSPSASRAIAANHPS